MIIKKKADTKFFQHILDSKKKFDLRLADFDMEKKELTGRTIKKKVKYVIKTKNLPYWTKEEIEKFGYQVISFD